VEEGKGRGDDAFEGRNKERKMQVRLQRLKWVE